MRISIFEISFKVAVIAGLVALAIFQLTGRESIVYVDAVKIMQGYKGMEAARKRLEEHTFVWRANLDTLRTELEVKLDEYEKKHQTLSRKEKELFEELIEVKRVQLQEYQTAINDKMQKENQEITTELLDKINGYIKRYGEENGYEIIMAATQYGNIVYAHQKKDVTDEVLQGLNREIGL